MASLFVLVLLLSAARLTVPAAARYTARELAVLPLLHFSATENNRCPDVCKATGIRRPPTAELSFYLGVYRRTGFPSMVPNRNSDLLLWQDRQSTAAYPCSNRRCTPVQISLLSAVPSTGPARFPSVALRLFRSRLFGLFQNFPKIVLTCKRRYSARLFRVVLILLPPHKVFSTSNKTSLCSSFSLLTIG